MSVFTRRKARHTIAAVRAARTAAELAEPAGRLVLDEQQPVDYDTSYDDPGWGDEPHDATSPGIPLAAPAATAPAGDDTMVWRVPGTGEAPGFAIPAATLQTDAEDQEHPEAPLPARTPGAVIPAALVPVLRTEPADPGLLREVRDALKALPGEPGRQLSRSGPAPEPAAWLRAVQPDGLPHLDTRLSGPARFARVIPSRRGPARFAEVEVEAEDGPYQIAADRAWLKATGMAFLQAADALPAGETPDGPGITDVTTGMAGGLQHGPVTSRTPA